ncbi:MAG: DNA polymerase III subunit alpha [Actinomycetota bacterium]
MFTHLHAHSNYSLREGAAHVGDLARGAAEYGMQALALTDHDGMYGAVRFTLACHEAGIRPILGAELEWGPGHHAVLLAEDATGWANLCHLVTEMHTGAEVRSQALDPGKRPRTTFEAIARHSKGLFALSGCDQGEFPWYAGLKRADEAKQAARRWLEVFGTEHFAIELSNHLRPQDEGRNRLLIEIAAKAGIKTVATNNVHYVQRSDAVIHDVADCMRRIVALTAKTTPRENAEYWLKPENEMRELLPAEAVDATGWVADKCRWQFPLGEFHYPDPVGIDLTDESATSVLARRCWEGAGRRYAAVDRKIEDRLQMELRMIRRGGFCGYFLLVADIVDHAKKQMRIRCACRGSAAGSLVAYLLGISEVDPIRYDLVFERFMNEHRREIPDIDVDFESARREEVNRYILDTYGERTAMVAMMDTYRARGSLREVGKALGLNPSEVDLIAKTFPHISAKNIPHALESLPEVAGTSLKASKLEMLFDISSRLDSFPRHLAMHPSGVILSDDRLADLMPMQVSFNGFMMSQFDKDDIEALGIAKLDVLGVRMFSTIAHTLDEIERTEGVRLDIDLVERGDPETFKLIRESRTLGCFQIESPGQRELLGKFQPEAFEDLITDISLFRPGPMKADMIRPFLERRHNWEPTNYPHPSLKPILQETGGVIVYHEQVMRVIAELTGCSLGEADKIRRSLDATFEAPDPSPGPAGGRPAGRTSAYDPLRAEVIAKATTRGWQEKTAAKIWDEVLSFASFGFCKAHAAAFAVPTYQSAWLKAHHPAAFYCGVLTHDPGMYPKRAILADARAHGIPIMPVDVIASFKDYRVERDETGVAGIRLGLQDVKGITEEEIASIIEGRPWKGFGDLRKRAALSRPTMEGLVHCGALDRLKAKRSRRELYWLTHDVSTPRSDPGIEQLSLELFDTEQIQLPGISDYSPAEVVKAELEITGLDSSMHILSLYLSELERFGWTPASQLLQKPGGATVVVAGVKVATQTPPVKSGKRVLFLTLEDGTGQSDITFFDEAQAKYARCVFDGWILAVRGTLRRTGARGVSVLAEQVIDLTKMKRTEGGEIALSKLWYSSGGSAGR